MDEQEDKTTQALQQIKKAAENIQTEIDVVLRCLTYLMEGY